MSQQKKFFFVTFNPVVRYKGVTKQRNMNMKKKKFVLLAIMAMTVLMLPGCLVADNVFVYKLKDIERI